MDTIIDTGFNRIELEESARSYLSDAAFWGKFLAIMGFIGAGFMIIAGIGIGLVFSTMGDELGGANMPFPPITLSLLYILIAIFYVFPSLYLMRFASNAQSALRQNSSSALTTAFKNLKGCYKFIGIATIVGLVLYILGIAGMVLFGASSIGGF